MNILLSGVPLREPNGLAYAWVQAEGRLLMEVRLHYNCLTEAEAAALLGAGVQSVVSLSCPDPRTGASRSLNVRCLAAEAQALLETAEGAVGYGPVSLTLREIPPAT